MRVAVVGHIEWVEFALVERVPAAGEIVEATESWSQAAGGGAVAAVQLARLAGECLFLTALGDDELGHAAEQELGEMGVRVAAAWRREPQRRAFVMLDAAAERTITTIGERLEPRRDDPLPWEELREVDAVYLTAGDRGAVQAARAAANLVSTPRAMEGLAAAGVAIDVLVSSSADSGERYRAGELDPPPSVIASTAGSAGGELQWADGRSRRWEAAPLPGPPVDAYGSGDSFAAGLTYGLGAGRPPEEAVELGARCGAACMAGRGPYEGQLRSGDVGWRDG
jgi:ribokinase